MADAEIPKSKSTKYNHAWLPHETAKANEESEKIEKFDVWDSGEKIRTSDYISLSVQS